MGKKQPPVTTPATLEEALVLIESLNSENSELSASNDKLAAELKTANETITELNQLVNELRSTPAEGEKPGFTHAGKTYTVTAASFIHNREKVTAEELCKNEALQAELVAKGSGLIEEVTD